MTGPAPGGANGAGVRGRCPSLLAPMESGDGLLVRVKPRAATLTAEQAGATAAAARRHGNGMIDLTNRGHLQVRGLSAAGVDAFAAAMAAIGLAATHPRAEAVRNVLADPLGPNDPAAAFDSHRLARRLSAALEGNPAFHELPDKFGLLVDAGAALPLAGCTADIMVRPDGGSPSLGLAGGDLRVVLPESAVEGAVVRLIAAFLAWKKGQGGGDVPSPPARMKAARMKVARMKTMVAACGAGGVFEAAGLSGAQRVATVRPRSAHRPAQRPSPGFVAMADGAEGYVLLAAPFGSLEAGALAALAALSRRYADGTIRVTPWKAVVLRGVSPAEAADLCKAAADIDLIAAPGDPRSRIVACAGRPRCASAHADTRADAAYLAGAEIPGLGLLHVSGCAKGCAHPGPAAATLVAAPGGYDLVRGGRPGDPAAHAGLTREAAARLLRGPKAAVSGSAGSASDCRPGR